ncbi:hypothetical protein [uncultured Jatrophihabitans sp.]|uniref:hypothetical protein n=1 Tax=uncultured Jatrophihabitans sp. TaxID=1610747 RepID=UPI0035CA9ACB
MRHHTSFAMLGVALLAATAAAACSTTTAGHAQSPTRSPSASTSPASPTPTATVTSAPQKTVTVVARPTNKRTVTKVASAPDVPHSRGSMSALLDDSDVVDDADYYTDDVDTLFFDAPSQNVGCYLYGDGTTACAIRKYNFPQNGPDCDAGIAATIDEDGNPSLTDCSGYFPVAARGAVLHYGAALVDGDAACVSESAGITCLNRETDTGFTISKQAFSPVY